SRAPIYLVVLQIAMVGLGMSIGVGSLKLRRQAFELSILKTRGARTGFLVGLQAAELLITGAIGWVLSLGIGLVLATMARGAHGPGAPGAPFDLSISGSAELIGLAGIAVGASVVLVLALPHIRRSVLAERREVSRERRPAWLRSPSEVLPLALGALALAELRRRGIQTSGSDLDPLVLVAPTLLLLGGSLFAVRLFFWAYGRSERAADRTGSPSTFLAIHRLSRSSADMALMLLLVLSVGLFSFSASLRSTVLTHNTNAARANVGADWRYLVPPPADEPRSVEALPGRTTLAFKGPVNISDDPRFAFATVVGVDPQTYPEGGWWRPEDSVDPLPDLLGRLVPAPIGFPIRPGVSTLEIEVTTPAPAPAGVHIWVPLTFPDGSVKDSDLGQLVPGQQTYRTTTDGAVRALSVMLAAPAQAPPSLVRAGHFSVTFDRVSLLGAGSSGAVDEPLEGWGGLQATGLIVSTDAAPSGGLEATFRVAGGGPIGGVAPTDPPLPAIVRVGAAGAGSPVGLRVGSVGFTIHPVGSLTAFPTIGRGSAPVIVPIDGLLERFEQILRPPNGGVFEVLGMGSRDPTSEVRHAGFEVGLVSRAADIEARLATSPQNLALGMEFAAGVAGAVLAVMALSLALFFGAQRRRYELSSLRALGGRASHAMIALAGEYGLILVPAFIVGAAVGTILLHVVLAYVAPPVAGTGLSVLVIDRVSVALAAGAALATLVLGLLSAGKQMRAGAPSAELRGEPE
ncbi:MAG: putative transport system permease protein, partial [Actinomycetota bacterium]|nr:putative transport system permease protein [Actinomycetota bacterium]